MKSRDFPLHGLFDRVELGAKRTPRVRVPIAAGVGGAGLDALPERQFGRQFVDVGPGRAACDAGALSFKGNLEPDRRSFGPRFAFRLKQATVISAGCEPSASLIFHVARAPLCQNELPNGFLSDSSLLLVCAMFSEPTPI